MPHLPLLLTLLSLFATPPSPSYAPLKQKAEALVAEKSFARAHAVYEEASRLTLSPEDRRWVEMRLADTAWRAAAEQADEEARNALEAQTRAETHDRAWAEANESLGDFELTRRGNLNAAVPWHTAALDWWSGNDDLALARRRYLDIVFRLADGDQWPQ